MRKRVPVAVGLVVLLVAGCDGSWGRDPSEFVKPTIAVMKFENRAPFPMNWDLGGGMQEVLVNELMETGRFHVVERAELNYVMEEQRLQASGATRAHGKAETGRIKNCRYLIKGTVTDFGHVSSGSGGWRGLALAVLGGSQRAVMGVILYVVDVESGEIVASESIEESVRASDVSVQAAYEDVAFGGSVFRQTPLGRATAKVVEKAVERITGAIADRPWRPLVARVSRDGTVILNGGTNHDLAPGNQYDVIETGEPILDPVTGDVIGHGPGRRVGQVIVKQVHGRWSSATIVAGSKEDFRPGQQCRRGL